MTTVHNDWKNFDRQTFWDVLKKYKDIATAVNEAGRMIEVGNAKDVQAWVNRKIDPAIRVDVVSALNEMGFNLTVDDEVNGVVKKKLGRPQGSKNKTKSGKK